MKQKLLLLSITNIAAQIITKAHKSLRANIHSTQGCVPYHFEY